MSPIHNLAATTLIDLAHRRTPLDPFERQVVRSCVMILLYHPR